MGAKAAPLRFSWISHQLPVGVFHALRRTFRTIKAWWNDVENFEIVPRVIEVRHRKWRWCGWFFGEKLINLMTIESSALITFRSEFNVAAFDFEDAKVTVADGNIALCTIRCVFNRKSKWWTWNRKHLNLTLQMDIMWNFNGNRISSASNNIVGRMLVQNDVTVGEQFNMEPGTGRRYEIKYISACTHDSNNIPTAIPLFSMSSNTTRLI